MDIKSLLKGITDRPSVERRVTALREKYGFTDFRGDNVEYHASGCVTFPLLAPAPYNKAWALAEYCKEKGLAHSQVAYVGDDYGPGGNDESVYLSDFNFVTIDDYRDFPEVMKPFL